MEGAGPSPGGWSAEAEGSPVPHTAQYLRRCGLPVPQRGHTTESASGGGIGLVPSTLPAGGAAARRCPQWRQNVTWLGLSPPQRLQFTGSTRSAPFPGDLAHLKPLSHEIANPLQMTQSRRSPEALRGFHGGLDSRFFLLLKALQFSVENRRDGNLP